jgi:hypothetical protein
MDRVEIPNNATYSPIALMDVLLAAPLASRVLLGATLPGRVLSMAALGVYAGSSLRDWWARQGVRRIEFMQEFGSDIPHLDPMPEAERVKEIRVLGEKLNASYTPEIIPRAELAREVNEQLTKYMSTITGQRVETSSEVRSFTLAKLIMPFALGACDVLSGDVAIFRDTGIFEAHIIAHEFVHRKGYWKELHAQALAYLALRNSANPVLVQSAQAERLHRNLRVLAGEDLEHFNGLVDEADLRPELKEAFHQLRPVPGAYEAGMSQVMRNLYDERMKLTGQNGLSDYDEGFTNFLYTFSRSPDARQPAHHASI